MIWFMSHPPTHIPVDCMPKFQYLYIQTYLVPVLALFVVTGI